MAFYGYHGNLESEQAQGQRFFVDVEIITDLTEAGARKRRKFGLFLKSR